MKCYRCDARPGRPAGTSPPYLHSTGGHACPQLHEARSRLRHTPVTDKDGRRPRTREGLPLVTLLSDFPPPSPPLAVTRSPRAVAPPPVGRGPNIEVSCLYPRPPWTAERIARAWPCHRTCHYQLVPTRACHRAAERRRPWPPLALRAHRAARAAQVRRGARGPTSQHLGGVREGGPPKCRASRAPLFVRTHAAWPEIPACELRTRSPDLASLPWHFRRLERAPW